MSGQPARLLFLFEHKSYVPSAPIHLQLLDYLLQIWEDDLKNRRPLSLVVPVVVYHGRRGWEQKPLSSSFPGLPVGWDEFIPDFHYLLTDLSRVPQQEILEKNEAGLLHNLFLALKYAHEKQAIVENWQKILAFGGIMQDDDSPMILLQTHTVYLFNLHDMTEAQVKSLSKQQPKPEQDWIDAIPEVLTRKWKEQGLKEGLEEGREQSIRSITLAMILKFPNLSDIEIAELTGAGVELVHRLRGAL